MILNTEEIIKKLSDSEDWEPVEFINHRREILRFEKVATVDIDGKNYAYLYEIDDDDEHLTEYPAVVLFGEEDGEYVLDFVTDKNLISEVTYEVIMMRRLDEDEISYEDNPEDSFEDNFENNFEDDPDGETKDLDGDFSEEEDED